MATKNLTAGNAAAPAATLILAPPPDFTEDRKQLKVELAGSIGSPPPLPPSDRLARVARSPNGDSLKTVARTQSNVLHDVTTLLDALQAALERVDTDDDIDPLFRLAQMAKVKVAGTISAFDAHI